VIFGPRKRHSSRREASVRRPTGEASGEASQHEAQLLAWRSAAQRVSREWNAWLAAEGNERGLRYGALVSALADEEKAAIEVERTITLTETRLGPPAPA
jgi:hypothetical protein